ncbi:nicotinate phosphoribosyltransferase [Egicoccus halophilus]|uniref:Nicotinate phosphoribosyltransferase n=1 Tax=Egicoccus halophilus TaxID=1670830 RepID=A0A8J3AA81_9ACTN|nr:nicotinate phosphoribosyltransferase [Egicoccus halophilus]GGI06182.1 nicotinate phosphoribosyltransferase [Egicoccus halophilus]
MTHTAPSTALLTDRYELTMLDAALRDGRGEHPSVFEVFARRLPAGRRYGVVAGTGRLLDALVDFRFDDDVLGWLDDAGVVSEPTLAWLAGYRFGGSISGYGEGEVYLPGSPVLTVHGTFAEAVVVETLVLSVLNHDSAVASAAARMVTAAGGRTLFEFGGRRAHEQAAVAAARAAYLAGFTGTSNLEAGRRHGLPTLGTSAHAFTLLHDDEAAAFAAQVAALGPGTTLLVDTYDTEQGLRTALRVAGTDLGAVRIDSGDLAAEARRARALLDEAGATRTRIVLSGDLDEHSLAALADAPADAYGVGTSVVTGSGAPTAGLVYKLVARAERPGGICRPVAKAGGDKATRGGRKAAWRRRRDGRAVAEVIRPFTAPPPSGDVRPLQRPLVVDGERVEPDDLGAAQERLRAALAELGSDATALPDGPVAIPTEFDDDPEARLDPKACS